MKLSRGKIKVAWAQPDRSRGGKKQLNPEYIVKKVQTKFADILDMGHERKQGVKDDSQGFSLTSGRMELPPTDTEKTEEGVRQGE